ncbi:MAG: SRPBCC family protein, partial [Chloroflexota bacterium]|nr:SRPBCC family protein [Chloroflexota bacterium]
VILEGSWVVTAIEPPTHYEARTTGAGNSEWKYRLAESNGRTHVVLTVQYDIPESVLQKVKSAMIEAMNQREADVYVQNLKMALEMQAA